MARYQRKVILKCTPSFAFAFVSDFRHTAEWDPLVQRADLLTPPPIGLGSRFLLTNRFPVPDLPYEIVEFQAPNRLTLRGETSSFRYQDSIGFEEARGGTRVSYSAQLDFKGFFRLGSPMLALMFQRIGDDALRGIEQAVNRAAPAESATAA
ncbi:MAG: SRPBCC family protein [Polyangiaceae bacterium]|nr:SRPBCC family protein [Myxococcales bacterium]MCB9588194.1 SRPBCC family protein [Polyangiaceae bacterium]